MTKKSILDNWEEEFNKLFQIIRAREKTQGRFQPILLFKGDMQENTDHLKTFIKSLLQAQKERDEKESSGNCDCTDCHYAQHLNQHNND